MESEDSTQPAAAPQLTRPKWLSPWVWQIVVLVVGTATILVGIVMLVAPGPGTLVIYAGIGILATEFIWARQLFTRIQGWVKQLIMRIRAWFKQKSSHKEP